MKITPAPIFARKCIEEGANIVVCHGPHSMRGVEAYEGGVIFHGLGNMIFQTDQQAFVPEEFYVKYGSTRQTCDGVGSINMVRSKHNTRGFITSQKEWQSAIVSMTCTNDKYAISLYPIEISKQTGLPSLSSNIAILEELKELSVDYGTNLTIEDGVGKHILIK